jgi:hypothetical protein
VRYIHSLHAILLIFSGIFLFSSTVFAVEESGVKLVPATIESLASPGDSLTENLSITNVSDQDREYYIYKRDIKGVENGGVPVFGDEGAEPTGYELSEWITYQTETVKVARGESVSFPITITVPETASPGSHFGGVFVSLEPPKLRETGAAVGYEVASIISIRISGDVRDEARIRALSTSKLFYPSKHVDFTAKIENQGNILIRPYGPLTITSMFSSKPKVIGVNDSLAGVFPGTVRDFSFSWDEDGVGFGRYEAVLALSYDAESGQKTIDASVVFWVFPLKVILPILFAFIGIILLGYLFTRYYINQTLMRAAGARRISSTRYRKQVGVSRFTFVFVSVLGVLVLFLIMLLIFFA